MPPIMQAFRHTVSTHNAHSENITEALGIKNLVCRIQKAFYQTFNGSELR